MDDDCDQQVDEGAACVAHKISAMGSFTCLAREDGTAYCWGENAYGQLGDGTAEERPTPVKTLATSVSSLAAGVYHTCALANNGVVSCWGKNDFGQLGDGSTLSAPGKPEFRAAPSEVVLPNAARDIATGLNHSCAVLDGNTVYCWGANNGTFGSGPGPSSSTPMAVNGLTSDVAIVVCGYEHTCALLFDRTVVCWGKNNLGQLGTGTTTEYDRPVSVPSLSDVVQLAADGHHTCALKTDGAVLCWGYHAWNDTVTSTPTAVTGLDDAVIIASGYDHDCALNRFLLARCWGANASGQLGDGRKSDRAEAYKVLGLSNAQALALDLGVAHSCAQTTAGVECWGDGEMGQLGDGSKLGAVGAIPAALPP